jgi:hypothetical protein
MEFDVQTSVDYILDARHSAQSRAIEFFTLLVVLYRGRSLSAISGNKSSESGKSSLVIEIPRKAVSAARRLAAMKFLDVIEQDWRARHKDADCSIRSLTSVPEFEEIINRYIIENGSWRQLRFSTSIRALERQIKKWRKRARNVARIIEFSFRFVPDPKKAKQIGGVTMATDIVTSARYFGVTTKDTQLEKAWSRLKSAAPFFYLIYVQKYPFYFRKVAGKRFADRFVGYVSDYDRLAEFFVSYNYLAEQLRNRGYRYSLLRLPGDSKPSPLRSEPFGKKNAAEREVLDEIESYRKS